jgi:hypothetical protein
MPYSKRAMKSVVSKHGFVSAAVFSPPGVETVGLFFGVVQSLEAIAELASRDTAQSAR